MCGECATLDQQVPDQTDMRGASTGGGGGVSGQGGGGGPPGDGEHRC